MRIGIDVNGVLRDTLLRIEQVYTKFNIDNPFITEEEKEPYEVFSPVTSLDIAKHLKFKDQDEVYDFLYREHTMEIFGHAPSVEMSTFNDFNEFYLDHRDNHDIIIVSDEIGKSKPATLFFLSKFGCQIEKIRFFSEITTDLMWNEIDVLLTANPNLLLNHPSDKKVIKFETVYNEDINVELNIKNIKDLNEIIKQL
jgi:hypothetical protein